MAGVASYIPAKQADFSAWLLNFSTLISANPGRYGLAPSDAATIAGYYATWLAAYTPVTSPATRTAALVSAKNTAYASIISPLRTYSQQIANNPGVSSDDKVSLGLNPKTSKPAPVSAPAAGPSLTVQSLGNLSMILRYTNPVIGPSSKAKPAGVRQLRLYAAASTTPITDASTLPAFGVLTRSPATISLASFDAGDVVYMAAAWATQAGLLSPLSGIVSFVVPTIG